MKHAFLNCNDGKKFALMQKVIGLCITEGDYSIAEFSRELNTSIPTVTKIVTELIEKGFIQDLGKIDTTGGRRPSIYGLSATAGYFVGTDVRRHHVSIAVTDFKGRTVSYIDDIPFTLESTEESFEAICALIREHLSSEDINEKQVLAYGFNLTGRVNNSGYSFSYFLREDMPIVTLLERILKKPAFVENDSRAMAYGEYISGAGNNNRDFLFFNVGWGLGMGMILDGKLSYGRSGFSGEVGHFPLLDNNQICHCGKIGCLETGASGSAIHRIVMEKLKEGRSSLLRAKYEKGEEITLNDILTALKEEDVLTIEVTEQIGSVLGRAIAGLINIFNPDLVVIGGQLAAAKDYLMLPVMSAINKYSLNMVSKDTSIVFSKLGQKAGPVGACLLARSRLIGLI